MHLLRVPRHVATSSGKKEETQKKTKKEQKNIRKMADTGGSHPTARIVLVDMDNTIVDYDTEFARRWLQLYPNDSTERIRRRQFFEMEKNFPPNLQADVKRVIAQPDFFRSLKPYDGAIEALREMHAVGLHVMLCTSPSLFQMETCAAGKYAWVREYLGEEWMPRLVITRDKTVVRGRVLIDDKPVMRGACERPEWTQVLFEQPYNVKVDKPRIKSWRHWRPILAPYLKQLEE